MTGRAGSGVGRDGIRARYLAPRVPIDPRTHWGPAIGDTPLGVRFHRPRGTARRLAAAPPPAGVRDPRGAIGWLLQVENPRRFVLPGSRTRVEFAVNDVEPAVSVGGAVRTAVVLVQIKTTQGVPASRSASSPRYPPPPSHFSADSTRTASRSKSQAAPPEYPSNVMDSTEPSRTNGASAAGGGV